MSVLLDAAAVGGRVPVPGDGGGAHQRAQHGQTDVRQEAGVGQEAPVPVGQRAEGVHHAWHHNERVHCVLATVLRAGAGQAVPQRPDQHTQLSEQPVPVAGLRQLAVEPREYIYIYYTKNSKFPTSFLYSISVFDTLRLLSVRFLGHVTLLKTAFFSA